MYSNIKSCVSVDNKYPLFQNPMWGSTGGEIITDTIFHLLKWSAINPRKKQGITFKLKNQEVDFY